MRGFRQFEIIAQLGMDPGQRSTVSRDIKAVKEAWRASAVRNFDEAKGQELSKLDLVEKEFWQAWERSKVEKVSTRQRQGKRGETAAMEAETKKERSDGDPRFLEGVLRCITKRCEILGLDAPIEIDHAGIEPKAIVFQVIDARTGQALESHHGEASSTTPTNGTSEGNGRLLSRDGRPPLSDHGPENGNGKV